MHYNRGTPNNAVKTIKMKHKVKAVSIVSPDVKLVFVEKSLPKRDAWRKVAVEYDSLDFLASLT